MSVLGVIFPVVEYRQLRELVACVGTAVSLGAGAVVLEDGHGDVVDPFVVLANLGERFADPALGVLLGPDCGRPPSIISKLVSGIDLATDGRAFVAVGDLDDQHVAASARDHEAVELISMMLHSDTTTTEGRYFRVNDAWNLPRNTTREHVPAKVARALSLSRLHEDRAAGVPPPSAAFVHVRADEEPVPEEFLGEVPYVRVETRDGQCPPRSEGTSSRYVRFRSLPSERELQGALST